MARRPLQAWSTIFTKRVVQGVGGKALGKEMAAGGKALAAGLIAGARDAGVDLWLNSPLKELVVEQGEALQGVVWRSRRRRASASRAGGVILAMGGFDHDERSAAGTSPRLSLRIGASATPTTPATARWISISGRRAGGAPLAKALRRVLRYPPLTPGAAPIFMLSERSLPGSMIVDSTGHRFFNEASDYMTAGRAMLATEQERQGSSPAGMRLIFDQAYRNRYLFAGAVMPRMPIPKVFYDSGVVVKADSIAELSRKIEVPGLVDGAARFNLLASQGQDDDFKRGLGHYDRYYGDPTHTPNPNLGPITKAPFYAVKTVPADLGTCGGITADERGRALRADGAGSTDSTPWATPPPMLFEMFYPGSGATIGQGVVFAYLAALHAAARART